MGLLQRRLYCGDCVLAWTGEKGTGCNYIRRIGVCEERGSGIDKVVFETEFYQLPAPSFETPEVSTRSVLFSYKRLNDMDRSEKVWA